MNNELEKNDSLIDNSLIKERNKYHYDKQLVEQNEYQNNITAYINRKQENNIKKNYNPKIVNLYNNGFIIINKEKYNLKDFFIVYNNILNNFHLKCIDQRYKNEEIEYNRAVRFIDTTSFINLINSSTIRDNIIIINNLEQLTTIINNWDGYLHNEVLETDSIMNKKMINYDI